MVSMLQGTASDLYMESQFGLTKNRLEIISYRLLGFDL